MGSPKWTIDYKNQRFNGSYAMIYSLNRPIEENYDILNPNYLAKITKENFKHIFRGKTEVSLAKERLDILRELGKIINNKFSGSFKKLLEEAEYNAKKLLEILTTNFPFFDYFGIYNSKKIHFQKRAQLLISDINENLNINEKKIDNLKYLTAVADYKIPMVLRILGITEYSLELLNIINNKIEIKKDDKREIEIRATMVCAIDLIKKEVNKTNPDIAAVDIDHTLWLISQKPKYKNFLYHRTRTIFY